MKTVLAIVFISVLVRAQAYQIPYPRGKAMESVTHLSSSLYLMSDFTTGNVMMADTKSRQMFTVVTAPPNRTIQGLAVVKKTQMIVTAGGGSFVSALINNLLSTTNNVENVVFPINPPGLHIYNLSLGTDIGSCEVPDAVVINDVTVDKEGKYAYFSDTRLPFLYRLTLGDLPSCTVTKLQLPDSFDPTVSGLPLGASGLAYYKFKEAEGIIISNYSPE